MAKKSKPEAATRVRQSQGQVKAAVEQLVALLRARIQSHENGFRPGQLISFRTLGKARLLGAEAAGERDWTWSDRRKALDLLIEEKLMEPEPPRGFRICEERVVRARLIVSNPMRPFVSELQRGVGKVEGLRVEMVGTDKDPDQEAEAIETAFRETDGVLLNPVMIPDEMLSKKHAQRVKELSEKYGGRLILVDRPYHRAEHEFCIVQSNNVEGGRIAGRYLFDRYATYFPGVPRVVVALSLFAALHYWSTPEVERLWGFEGIVQRNVDEFEDWPLSHLIRAYKGSVENGYPPLAELVPIVFAKLKQAMAEVPARRKALYEELRRAVIKGEGQRTLTPEEQRYVREHRHLPELPFACFCVNDELAAALIGQLSQQGLWISEIGPEEVTAGQPRVMVVGFDRLEVYQQIFRFPSVKQPMETIGERAAKLLLKHARAGTIPEHETQILLNPEPLI